jgi:hypothetical protein
MGDGVTWESYSDFLASPAGKNYQGKDIRIAADGQFRIEGVPPDHYQLFVAEIDADGRAHKVGYREFEVETMPGGVSDEPLNIGEIEIPKHVPATSD